MLSNLVMSKSMSFGKVKPTAVEPHCMRRSRYFFQGRGGPSENALVLLYDTLICRFQLMLAIYNKSLILFLYYFHSLSVFFFLTIYVKPLFLAYICCKAMLLPVLIRVSSRAGDWLFPPFFQESPTFSRMMGEFFT